MIDNLSRGNIRNLESVLDKILFVPHDMRFPILTPRYDIVFDLAAKCYGITKLYQDEPDFISTNTRITLNTLECLKNRVDHYFYISSSCVYDFEGCPKPHKEEYSKEVPKSAYDITKRFGEELVKIFAKEYGFGYIIIRPFNVFGLGEGEDGPHVITDFLHRIEEETRNPTKKFWMLGSGEQTRSFTYIEDFVDALIFLLDRVKELDTWNQTFNVGTQVENSINELMETMFELWGLPLEEYEIEHRPPIKGDVQERNPDVTKINNLGWKASYTLREALQEMHYECT